MILFTFFALSQAEGQTCDCSDFPTYKCIETGSRTFAELITDGDLLDYLDAATTAQNIVIVDNIDFGDNNPDPYIFAPSSNIVILPGASIYVNKSVVFDQTSIVGCQNRWDQIAVFSGGNLKVKECYVANGCQGIVLENGAMAEIVSTEFFNNGHSIQITGDVKLLGEGISHNLFNSAAYGSTTCLNVPTTRYAIVLNNVPPMVRKELGGDFAKIV